MSLKKSQATIEFTLILAILLIIFLSFFALIQDKNSQFDNTALRLEAKTIAERVGLTINDVHLAGNNSKAELYLPQDIHSRNYSLKVIGDSREVVISLEDIHYTYPVLTSEISGELEIGQNSIVNEGDRIVLG